MSCVYILYTTHTKPFTHKLLHICITMYRVRVDIKSDLQPKGIIGVGDSYVIVKHVLPHGNPHYHMLLDTTYGSNLKINALRQRVTRYFNVSADEYSVKQCDENRQKEYLAYMFNEKHGNQATLIDYKGYAPIVIETAQIEAKEIAEDFRERQKARKEKRKKTIYDIAEEIYTYAHVELLENRSNFEETIDYQNLNPQYYVPIYTRHAIRILHENRQPFDYFHLRKIICTAMSMDKRNHAEIGRRVTQFFLD